MTIWLPDEIDVERIHFSLVELFAKGPDPIFPPGVKDQGLLGSACLRPYTSIGKVEKYPSLRQKVSALFHSLAKNHAFHNGNKRTAVATLLTTLFRNGMRLRKNVTDDILYEFVVSVADDAFPHRTQVIDHDYIVNEIGGWLAICIEAKENKISTMSVVEFVKKCQKSGATARPARGGVMVLQHGNKTTTVRLEPSRLEGRDIKSHLKKLGINSYHAGIDIQEFHEGYDPERAEIYRYIATLQRLAKT